MHNMILIVTSKVVSNFPVMRVQEEDTESCSISFIMLLCSQKENREIKEISGLVPVFSNKHLENKANTTVSRHRHPRAD